MWNTGMEMAPDPARGQGREPAPWPGARRGFREERGRLHRRLRLGLLVVGLCAYGLGKIWLSTEVACCGSRITELSGENQRLATDLTVALNQLEQRRTYGSLLIPAERAGFGTAGEVRVLAVAETPAPPAPRLWAQVESEIRSGSRLILSEALAQDRRWGGRSRGERP